MVNFIYPQLPNADTVFETNFNNRPYKIMRLYDNDHSVYIECDNGFNRMLCGSIAGYFENQRVRSLNSARRGKSLPIQILKRLTII